MKQTILPVNDSDCFRHKEVLSNGIRLHTVQAGGETGPLVILLHGFPEDWRTWKSQIHLLSERGFWVWAPDQRGYNLSDKPGKISDYRIDMLAADVIGLIEAAGREKAIIIGHDWGASVAWWISIHFPERVHKLIALNGAHVKIARDFRLRNLRQILKSLYVLFFLIPVLPGFLASRSDWAPLIRRMRKGTTPDIFSPDCLDGYKKSWALPGTFRAMLNWYRAAVLYFPKLNGECRVELPVLLLWGENDRYIDKRLAEESVKMCANAKLIFFKDAGHWILHESSQTVNAKILQFLSEG